MVVKIKVSRRLTVKKYFNRQDAEFVEKKQEKKVSVQRSQNRTLILRIRQIYADFKNFFVFYMRLDCKKVNSISKWRK